MSISFACKLFNLEDIIRCGFSLSRTDYNVLLFLCKNSKQYTTHDIAAEFDLDLSTVQRSIKSLHGKNLVQRIQKNMDKGGYVFLYYVENKGEIVRKMKEIIKKWNEGIDRELNSW